MTLIAAFQSKATPDFVGLSDLMVSATTGRAKNLSFMPMRPPSRDVAENNAIGFLQKSLIVGENLFMWSGNLLQARSALRELTREIPQTVEDIGKALSGLNRQDYNDLGLVYANFDGRRVSAGGFETLEVEDDEIWGMIGGSGSGDLFYDRIKPLGFLASESAQRSPAMLFLTQFLGGAISSELGDNDNWTKNYGGGFEFTFLKQGGGFRKLSYRIDYFGQVGDDLGHFGTNFFCYLGRHLIVLSIFPVDPEAPEVPAEAKINAESYSFRWRSIPGPLEVELDPRLMHIRRLKPEINLALVYWGRKLSLDWPNPAPMGINFHGARLGDVKFGITLDVSEEHLVWKRNKIAALQHVSG